MRDLQDLLVSRLIDVTTLKSLCFSKKIFTSQNHVLLHTESLDVNNESYQNSARENYWRLSIDIPVVIIGSHISTQTLHIFGLRSFDVTVAQEGKSVLVAPPDVIVFLYAMT